MSLSGLYKGTTFLSQSPMGPMSWRRDIPQGPAAGIILGAAFSTGVAVAGTVGGLGAFTFLGLSAGWTSVFASFLTSVALGYALNALTPKPNLSAAGAGYASVNALSPAAATGNIYGATRVGGITFYQETTNNNKFLHKLVAVAGHEVNAIGDIYLNDELVTLDGSGNVTSPSNYITYSKDRTNAGSFVVGKTYKIANTGGGGDEPNPTDFVAIGAANNNVDTVFTATGAGSGNGSAYLRTSRVRLIKHLGTADQAADADLVSESLLWTSNHRARGIAYIYARFEYSADAFPNGVPVITTVVQGKKVYDPRTETTAYSSNAALCLRDYLISSGVAFTSEIDDTLFSTAANICDETVALDAGGTQLRYTTNGTFTSEAAPKDALSNLLTSMGGMLWYSQGKWGCKAAAYTSPVLSLDEDDLRSGLQIQTRNSRRDGFNKITGIFRGPESNYFETNYPTLAPAAFLSVDNNQESELELALPYVDTSAMAQRIAKIALYRNREQLKISGSFGMRAYQLSIGDLVQITNTRLGFADKVFEVVEWRFGLNSEMALEVFMTLQELSSGVFQWNADESLFESNNTTLLSPYLVPAVAVALTQEYRIVNEKITNVLVVNVSSPNAERVDNVEVVYKKDTDEDYSVLGVGDLGRFEILEIDTPLAGSVDQIRYEVRARATNALGVKGEFASEIIIVEADTVGPDAPQNFAKQLSAGSIFFSWTASTALDLSYYKIWHSSSTSAVWADGSVLEVIEKVARPATTVSYPALSGTFFIEPYDKSGNAGEVSSVVVLPADLPQLGVAVEDVENPTFAGTKTNTTVVSSELQLSSYATAPATGTYEFTGYIDTTTVRTVRVSDAITVSRHHANAVAGEVNWDDISSSYNWSQWPDSWDTWTDEDANFGDFSVVTYVSATDDDPAGSPTWGAWTVAAGDKSGRAFKFKAELANISNNVTPSISVLKGIVEY
jgi:hypothetical protein